MRILLIFLSRYSLMVIQIRWTVFYGPFQVPIYLLEEEPSQRFITDELELLRHIIKLKIGNHCGNDCTYCIDRKRSILLIIDTRLIQPPHTLV